MTRPSDDTVTATGRRVASQTRLPWRVTVIASADAAFAGQTLELSEPLTLGRGAPGVDRPLDDVLVSRRHVTLAPEGDGWSIEDHDSKNGTFVDGRPVTARTRLSEGDIIRVGGTLLELDRARLAPAGIAPDPELIGRTLPHLRVLHSIRTVARTDVPVLILGETGTGKELVARRVHRESGRPGPLVVVNCAAIPANLAESVLFGHRRGAFTGAREDAVGKLRAAEGGTLLLDEVGDLPLELQPKLLRAVETHEFCPVGSSVDLRCDVRIVAATNVDLPAAAANGEFRSDLYARLAGLPITVPPLRKRRADVPLLLQHFLTEIAPAWSVTVSAEALEALVLYPWPMNIRELRATAQRLTLGERGSRLLLEHLPAEILRSLETAPEVPERVEPELHGAPSRDSLTALLERYQGNIARVAQHLGKQRTQVYRWLKRYGLSVDRFRRE